MSDNLKFAKECGATENEMSADGAWNICMTEEAFKAYTSRILASQQAAHEAEIAKLKDDEFSESKDWKESDISGRIDWLMSRVKSFRKDIALLTEQLAEAEQRGAVKALEEAINYIMSGRINSANGFQITEKLRRRLEELRATSKKAG